MTSLLIHAALGVLTVVVFFRYNRYLYARAWQGSGVTWLEGLYYVLAIGSVCTGWYFNVTYVKTYPAQASWVLPSMSSTTRRRVPSAKDASSECDPVSARTMIDAAPRSRGRDLFTMSLPRASPFDGLYPPRGGRSMVPRTVLAGSSGGTVACGR
jgi:hypothetical protein